MTRKRNIGIAVAVLTAVAIAIVSLPPAENGRMIITYAGVSASDSNRVVFTITNASRVSLYWTIHLEPISEDTSKSTAIEEVQFGGQNELKGLSATNFESHVLKSDGRWRPAVWYDRPIADSFLSRFRGKCIHFAYAQGWYRLGNWLQPHPKALWAYGPPMVGHQPVPMR